jgi:hypothetical protein
MTILVSDYLRFEDGNNNDQSVRSPMNGDNVDDVLDDIDIRAWYTIVPATL